MVTAALLEFITRPENRPAHQDGAIAHVPAQNRGWIVPISGRVVCSPRTPHSSICPLRFMWAPAPQPCGNLRGHRLPHWPFTYGRDIVDGIGPPCGEQCTHPPQSAGIERFHNLLLSRPLYAQACRAVIITFFALRSKVLISLHCAAITPRLPSQNVRLRMSMPTVLPDPPPRPRQSKRAGPCSRVQTPPTFLIDGIQPRAKKQPEGNTEVVERKARR